MTALLLTIGIGLWAILAFTYTTELQLQVALMMRPEETQIQVGRRQRMFWIGFVALLMASYQLFV
jgi:hypothetical protein